MNGQTTINLSEVKEAIFINEKNAKVEKCPVFKGKDSKPGYSWYIFSYAYMKGQRRGAIQVTDEFTRKHGPENVKRMIIHNVVNKIK